MHKLLKRQLKKTNATVDKEFLELVNQAYKDADEDRELNEHAINLSSKEMQGLYDKLKASAEEKIRQSEERYNKLISALDEYYFFYAHDLTGKFIYVSDSVKNILGYEKEECFQHFSNFLTDSKMNEIAGVTFQKAISGEQTKPIVLEVKDKNRSVKYLEVTAFPSFDRDGNIIEVEGIARDVTQSYHDHKKLNFLSNHDTLTGIDNRYSFQVQLEEILKNAKVNRQKIALLYIDIDNFKRVNDTLGHDKGDELLIFIAHTLKKTVRQNDVVARMGGDEFTIVLTDIDNEIISKITDKISLTIMRNLDDEYKKLSISVSIGVAIYPDNGEDKESLIKYADLAMYEQKHHKSTPVS
jgi:diguanylate cyclase (GGDEF)-like protein/PAS domain S-box-containing protein